MMLVSLVIYMRIWQLLSQLRKDQLDNYTLWWVGATCELIVH